MSKPRIFSHCKAGCEWETVHRSEVEAIAAFLPVPSDGLLDQRKTYRIAKAQEGATEWGFSLVVSAKCNVNGQADNVITREFETYFDSKSREVTIPKPDAYTDYMVFKWLDFVADPTYNTYNLIVEINGERHTMFVASIGADYDEDGYPDGDSYAHPYEVQSVAIKGAAGAWLYNEDATLTAEKIFIRYSANADGSGYTEEWSAGRNYIGIATGQEAPTDKNGYEWVYIGGYLLTDNDKAEIVSLVLATLTDASEVAL